MALAPTSLSLAVQGIADVLDAHFGGEVQISVDTPLRAQENARRGDRNYLNLFIYRVAPSGFHGGLSSEEPAFLRLYGLITPCLADQDGETGDKEMRLLGHAIRVLHSEPVIPQAGLPPAHGGGDPDFRTEIGALHLTEYRLQSILQAPSMEELNHIWTTQGGELAYRLSAAYEFALVPIEPLERREEAGPVRSGLVDLTPTVDTDRDPMMPSSDMIGFGLAGDTRGRAPSQIWQPILMFSDDEGQLSSVRSQAADTPSTQIALAGAPEASVALEIVWKGQAPGASQKIDLSTHRIDDPAARLDLNLPQPWPATLAVIRVRVCDENGQPLPDAPFANTLTLTAEAP